jgi:transposase
LAVLEPHVLKNQLGVPRVDDRRVISGILYVLRSGCRWRNCPPEYGPSTTIYNRYDRRSAQGALAQVVRTPCRGRKHSGRAQLRQHPYQGSPLCGWAKKGEAAQAISRSRGGRTSKIHALANAQGKPRHQAHVSAA